MSYEEKDGDISIFKNEKKEGKQPDYTGKALVDGTKMRVSLWVREGAKGKFFSGRIEPFVERITPKTAEDDLPF